MDHNEEENLLTSSQIGSNENMNQTVTELQVLQKSNSIREIHIPIIDEPNHQISLPNRNETETRDGSSQHEQDHEVNDFDETIYSNLGKMSRSQKMMFDFFERPATLSAKIFNWISFLFIFFSTILVSIETLPQFTNPNGVSDLTKDLFPLEVIITLWWLIELLGRFYASTEKIKFFTKVINIIDLISILPFFMLLSNNLTVLNASRFFRILRLLKAVKLAKYSIGIQLAYRALKRSKDAIWMLFLFILLSLLLTSTAMYWVERGTFDLNLGYWVREDGTRSPFNSIPEGFYWSMTTLSTVGYGDVTPITALGKFIAALTMFISILTIALPTSIIGSNFMAEWQSFQKLQLQKKMKKNREKAEKSLEKETGKGEKFREVKSDNLKILNEQNQLFLQAIGEIQEKLNDINPPQFYMKWKELDTKYIVAKHRIELLEKEVSKWKKIAREKKFQEFNNFKDKISSKITQKIEKSLVSADTNSNPQINKPFEPEHVRGHSKSKSQTTILGPSPTSPQMTTATITAATTTTTTSPNGNHLSTSITAISNKFWKKKDKEKNNETDTMKRKRAKSEAAIQVEDLKKEVVEKTSQSTSQEIHKDDK